MRLTRLSDNIVYTPLKYLPIALYKAADYIFRQKTMTYNLLFHQHRLKG